MAQSGTIFQQGSFSSGEISPDFAGMLDQEQFFTSCRILENMLVTRSNGISQRGGINHKLDYALWGKTYWMRNVSLLVGSEVVEYIVCCSGYESASNITILNSTDYSVILEEGFVGLDATASAKWDIAAYDEHAIIVRGSSGLSPLCLYWDGAAFQVVELADMYGVGNPFELLESPFTHWPGWAPISVSFMLSRFIFIDRKAYYGSMAGEPWNYTVREYQAQTDQEEQTPAVAPELIVTSASAFRYIVDNQDDSGQRWIRSGLFAMGGSARGAWIMSNFENGLDATNPNIKNHSGYGCSELPALYIDGYFFYFDASERSPRIFTINNNGPVSIALGEYSEHIFRGRTPIQMILQTVPQTIVWILMDDGQLVAFQHEPTTKKAAWSRHFIRNTAVEHIAITDDRRLVALCNRNGYRYFAEMDKPYSDEWHDTVDSFKLETLLPDTAYVSSSVREDENGLLEITVNGPIENDRPYKLVNSGGLTDPYYLTEYAVDPTDLPNELKKLWLKDRYGEYVYGESDEVLALDPRGYAILAVGDSAGNQSVTFQGDGYGITVDDPILLQFNDTLDDEYYLVSSALEAGGNTTITLKTPLSENVLYDSEREAVGTVMINVPYYYMNPSLPYDTLAVVADRHSYEEVKANENGIFTFNKPYMGIVVGEVIDSRFAPRFFTDKLGPRRGRILHFYPYLINTSGIRYGVKRTKGRTYPYNEVEAFTGPSDRCSLGDGATADCIFYIYSAPGSRLEISHIFYELEAT